MPRACACEALPAGAAPGWGLSVIDEFVSLVNPVLFEPPFPPEGAADLFRGLAKRGAARARLKVSEPEPAYFRRGGLGGSLRSRGTTGSVTVKLSKLAVSSSFWLAVNSGMIKTSSIFW